jgi:hypothetical protein
MKKIIIASIAALSLSASVSSFASVQQDEVAYLFGTQSAVEMQVISATEMQNTEGQLFGITMETTKKYLGLAFNYVKPYAVNYANVLKEKALTYIKGRLDTFLANQG